MSTHKDFQGVAYVRLSVDKTGKAPSIDSQLEICRQLSADHGIPIVAELVDRDESASAYRRKNYQRPDWTRLLKGLKTGQWNCVLTPAWDRGSREGIIGLAEIIEHLPKNGRFITGNHGEMDLRTSHGRMLAAIIAEQAAAYSEAISEKTKIGVRRRALQGKPHAGGYEPWGHTRQGLIIPEEANVIRSIFSWIMDEGLTLTACARRLNEEGIKAKQGGVWAQSNVSLLLRSPRLYGIHFVDGQPVPTYEPILTEEQFTALQQTLSTSAAQRTHARLPNTDPLLVRLIQCAECKQGMSFYWQHSKGGRLARYKCTPRNPQAPKHLQKGCGVSISQPLADKLIVRHVADVHGTHLDPLAHSPSASAEALKASLDAEIADLREREHIFTQEFLKGKLDKAIWGPGRADLLDRIVLAEKQRDLLEDEEPSLVGPGPNEDAHAWFADPDRSPEDKRSALRASLVSVLCFPSTGNKNKDDRVKPVWRYDRLREAFTELGKQIGKEYWQKQKRRSS